MIWKPTMTADEWFEMSDKTPDKVSLRPKGMEPLSSLSKPNDSKIIDMKPVDDAPYIKNSNNGHNWTEEELKSKQDDLKKSVSARVPVNYALEQDKMEGVDPDEWNE